MATCHRLVLSLLMMVTTQCGIALDLATDVRL